MINLKNTKIFIGGIQGSGKTYHSVNYIIPAFNNVVVYAVHVDDFKDIQHKNCKVVSVSDFKMETLDKFCEKVVEVAKNGECDLFVLDEADLFLPNNLETLKSYKNFWDMTINHRHYNLAILFITRRPQSIASEVVEQCEHTFLFAISGDNVKRKMRDIHSGFKPLIPHLDKDKHNFIYFRTGEEPKLYSSAEVIDEEKKDITLKEEQANEKTKKRTLPDVKS